MVVGNLTADVMEDVSLRDPVGSMSSEPSEEAATTSKKVAIKGSKGTTGEGELGRTVVGEDRVGVLKESDQDKPVVDP